jgi:hypothetical protein
LACHLQIDADPDPAYHFDAEPDPGFYLMRIRTADLMQIWVTKMMRIRIRIHNTALWGSLEEIVAFFIKNVFQLYIFCYRNPDLDPDGAKVWIRSKKINP